MRRLPIYFVVETGESMQGEPIESVRNGLQMLIAAMRKDPQCLETAHISIITFGNCPVQIVPLTPLNEFDMPNFTVGGGCVLGEALQLLCRCREREVTKATAERKGDWCPLAFFITDSVPTDDPKPGIESFRSQKWGASVCCAAGPGADKSFLEKISPGCVLELATADQATIGMCFKWISQSCTAESTMFRPGARRGGGFRNWDGRYYQCVGCGEIYKYSIGECPSCGAKCREVERM